MAALGDPDAALCRLELRGLIAVYFSIQVMH